MHTFDSIAFCSQCRTEYGSHATLSEICRNYNKVNIVDIINQFLNDFVGINQFLGNLQEAINM